MITTPPSPTEAADEAAFVAELRRLKTWSGRSFRQLERHAAAAGDTLPASTVATMLGKHRLPREELLVAFVRACGLDEDDIRPWLTTCASIADGTKVDAAAVAPATSPRQPATSQWRSQWRLAIVAAALAMAFAAGATLTAGLGDSSTDEQETVVLTP
jgi:hypothetical protein